MIIPNLSLYPASLIQPGDVIATGNMNHPDHYTVVEVKQLKVSYEILCQPYRRFVVSPTDGLWIIRQVGTSS